MSTEFLETLMHADGVSGKEIPVRNEIMKAIKPYVSSVSVDNLGNLVAHKKGKGPRVMLAAHMDEVGFMARTIDENGRIYFSSIGTIDPTSLIGQEVKVQASKGWVHGVITTKNTSDGIEEEELAEMKDMYVDTGLNHTQLQARGIEPGVYIHYETVAKCRCDRERIFGKGLDDRIGCYILVELAKRLKKLPGEIYYVFTVQEELGLYGSKTSAYQVEPAWAIAVDVTATDEHESVPSKILGSGPCITAKDSDMIGNACINGWLKEISKKQDIPLQIDVSETGTTDALSISLSRGGVPSTTVGVAIRNLHTPVSMASMSDVENCIKLLEALLKKPPEKCIV